MDRESGTPAVIFFLNAYEAAGVTNPAAELPRAAVIARARLIAVHRTEDVRDRLSAEELAFGFYGDGRSPGN